MTTSPEDTNGKNGKNENPEPHAYKKVAVVCYNQAAVSHFFTRNARVYDGKLPKKLKGFFQLYSRIGLLYLQHCKRSFMFVASGALGVISHS